MQDIILNEYPISSIRHVLHNSMTKGHIRNDRKGRHSDCLVYVLSGKTKYTFNDGRTFTVLPKDVLFLAKDSLYCMDILSDVYEVIYVDFYFITSEKLHSNKFTMPSNENMELLFQKLNRKWILKAAAYKSECFIVLYKIYSTLIQSFTQPYLSGTNKAQIKSAMDYLAQNYTNPKLNICTLAKISGISEGHFRRLFKNIFSTSPNQYIRNLRIKYAKELLQYGTQNISSIAELSGFQNSFYFCKIFKQETGYTPTEYRKRFDEV